MSITSAEFRAGKHGGQQRHQALGRMKYGAMNKTETRYSERLEEMKHRGEIQMWQFQPFNIRLAEKCYYSPDFLVLTAEGYVEIHEVKGGYLTEDSLVKIKAAAERLPFRFLMYSWKDKKWEEREF